MRNQKRMMVTAVVLSMVIQSCANTALNRKIDSAAADETAIKTHADLRGETEQLIVTAPGLTTEQRSALSTLWQETCASLDSMWSQSLKLRSVLLKDMVSKNYDADEVELIKRRIREVENKRLAVTFAAVEKANLILGHETYESRARLMDIFLQARAGGVNR